MAYAATLLVGASLVFWWASKTGPPLLVGAALLILLITDAVISYHSLSDPKLELRNPPDAVTGGYVSYQLRAANVRRPLLVLPAGPFRQHAVLVDHDGPGMITLPAPPRGTVRYLLLDLIATAPLGFFETVRRVLVPLPVPMLVAPPLFHHEIEFPEHRPVGWGEVEHAVIGEDLFKGVRNYVRGDPRRKVHWPASAHSGTLMVKETDGTGVVPIRIVLVLDRPGPGSELAAGRAAYVAESCSRRGWQVHLVTMENPGEPILPGLGIPLMLLPRLLPPPPVPPQTVSKQVQQRMEVSRRLSMAGYGNPVLDPSTGHTLVISAAGDHWL